MDIDQLIKDISNAPIYVWVILFFVVKYFFRDKTRWKKEVNFLKKEGVGRGEVEIEYSKRQGTTIEVEMKLVEKYQQKPISILINDQLIFTLPGYENDGSGKDHEAPCDVVKPNAGDLIKVVIENETIFDGEFR